VLPFAQTVSTETNIGHRVHAFAEAAHKAGREAALADVDEDIRTMCEAIPQQFLDSASFASEVAFALDLANGKARELGRGIGRAYGDLAETEYAGTADLVALVDTETVYVGDFKRSLWALPPAAQSVQLGFYALAACRAYGRSRAIVELIPYGTDERPDRAVWSAFDLDEFELNLLALHSRQVAAQRAHAEGATPSATIGPHCRYCPSFAYCPANTRLAIQMARPDALAAMNGASELTPESAAVLWPKLRQAEAVLAGIRKALETFAVLSPFRLPDGTEVRVRETRRETIDGDVAHAILAAFSPKLAELACSWNVTKGKIREAAKVAGMGEEEILAELRRHGAVKSTVSSSVVEVKAKKREAA
jgi:hypothetical protein